MKVGNQKRIKEISHDVILVLWNYLFLLNVSVKSLYLYELSVHLVSLQSVYCRWVVCSRSNLIIHHNINKFKTYLYSYSSNLKIQFYIKSVILCMFARVAEPICLLFGSVLSPRHDMWVQFRQESQPIELYLLMSSWHLLQYQGMLVLALSLWRRRSSIHPSQSK